MMPPRRTMDMPIVSGVFLIWAVWIGVGIGSAMAGEEEGKKVFEDKNCIRCHSLGEEKGKMAQLGGPLDGVGSKRETAWLKSYLLDPKSQIPDAKMPKQTLTDKELEDLVAYLLNLK